MKRVLTWGLAAIVAAVIASAIYMRSLDHPVEEWHVDPAAATRSTTDNDYLVAPEGMAEAEVDRVLAPRDVAPKDLLFLFDSIASNAPRTTRIAMDEDGLAATYVQISALLAFPDYISVKAVPVGDGAGLVIWSRSRFGKSDLGVNRERIEEWLAKLGS